ncbi:MAG: transposase [Cyanobacterium sp.]
MSPRKLSEGDRTEILDLYRSTDATSSTLADRYGVSNSTVSRFLKMSLSTEEYDSLIQQKRLARSNSKKKKTESKSEPSAKPTQKKAPSPVTEEKSADIAQNQEVSEDITENQEVSPPPVESIAEEESDDIEENQETSPPLDEDTAKEKVAKPILKTKKVIETTPPETTNIEDEEEEDDNQKSIESFNTVKEMFGEEIVDDDDDEDEFDDDDDEFEDDEEQEVSLDVKELIVLPLSEAKFNRNCYLAIDRTAELMTRPLKDFAELGNIPQEETNQKTLPIFENHRVAKRFCDRRGKVIKVPDTKIIEKTASCLKSKGITRVLMNGKVFNLNLES